MNWGDCNPAEYSFSSGVYPHGVPGFVANGTNTFEFLVENSYGISFVGLGPGGSLDVRYVGGVPRLEISDQTPEIDRRLLLHKYGSHDTYPSQYQRRRVAAGSPDGEMEIVAQVSNLDGTSAAGKWVYFRLEDASGGNLGDAPSLIPDRVQVDQNGRATVVLKAQPNTASGNDYRIKASLDVSVQNTGLCGTECSMSGVITTWKRAYLEKHAMLRQGSFIHHVDGNRVFVYDLSSFHAPIGGTAQVVRLIHAPPFSTGTKADFWWTDASVLTIQSERRQKWAGYIEIDKIIEPSRSYGADLEERLASVRQMSDFAGIISSSGRRTPADYFELNYGLVDELFRSAAVQYVAGPPQVTGPDTAVSDFPFVASAYRSAAWTLAMKWQQFAARSADARVPLDNHKMVIGFSKETETNTQGYTLGTNNNGTALTMINRARIEDIVKSYQDFKTSDEYQRLIRADGITRETVVHELTHQWRVNTSGTDGHCGGIAEGSVLLCLMNEARKVKPNQSQTWDGIVGWHGIATTNPEAESVRTFSEPMLQDSPAPSFNW